MGKTQDFIRQRICWKAKKFKLSANYTFFFEDLSIDRQDHLKQTALKEISGQPVLFFTDDKGRWTLICTNSVIGTDGKDLYKVNYQDIQSILPKIMDDVNVGEVVNVKGISKNELNELAVTLYNGAKFIFYTKTGQDHFALHNVLLMLKQIL